LGHPTLRIFALFSSCFADALTPSFLGLLAIKALVNGWALFFLMFVFGDIECFLVACASHSGVRRRPDISAVIQAFPSIFFDSDVISC
jgi:hypothetical protein